MGIFDFLRWNKEDDNDNKNYPAPTTPLNQDGTYNNSNFHYTDYNYDVYCCILFSAYIDYEYYIGNKRDYMRPDYTTHPNYGLYCNYIRRLFQGSKQMLETTNPQKFFESKSDIESILKDSFLDSIPHFNRYEEKKLYDEKIDSCVCDFLDRSYQNEFRKSLELKTEKGRAKRIENWLGMIDYYKQYMNEMQLSHYNSIKSKWENGLPN